MQTTITDQVIREEIDLGKLLDRALTLADYDSKRRRFAQNRTDERQQERNGDRRISSRGGFHRIGRALFEFRGGRGRTAPTARVRVLVSSTEIGQGTNTILCQVAAETLGLPYADVEIAQPDTTAVPNSGPTVASRTAMVVGKLVQSAALGVQQTLTGAGMLGASYTAEEFRSACREYVSTHGQLRSLARYEQPANVFWDDQKYRGEAYAAFAWAVYVAEVTVDLDYLCCFRRRFRGLAGSRQGAQSRSGQGADRRRRGAGNWICAV